MAPSGAPLVFQPKGLEKLAPFPGEHWTDAAKLYLKDPNFVEAMKCWAVGDPQHVQHMLEKIRRLRTHQLQNQTFPLAAMRRLSGGVYQRVQRDTRDKIGGSAKNDMQTKAEKLLARIVQQRRRTHGDSVKGAAAIRRQCDIVAGLLFELLADHRSSSNSYFTRNFLEDDNRSEFQDTNKSQSADKSQSAETEGLEDGQAPKCGVKKSQRMGNTRLHDGEAPKRDDQKSRKRPAPSGGDQRSSLNGDSSEDDNSNDGGIMAAGPSILTATTPKRIKTAAPKVSSSDKADGALLPSSINLIHTSSTPQRATGEHPLATSKETRGDLLPPSTEPIPTSSTGKKVTYEEPPATSTKRRSDLLLDITEALSSSSKRQRVAREESRTTSKGTFGNILPLSAGTVQCSSSKPQKATREEQTTSSGEARNHLLGGDHPHERAQCEEETKVRGKT